jgi:hypothetical protein
MNVMKTFLEKGKVKTFRRLTRNMLAWFSEIVMDIKGTVHNEVITTALDSLSEQAVPLWENGANFW